MPPGVEQTGSIPLVDEQMPSGDPAMLDPP